jgi:hypothetical protein
VTKCAGLRPYLSVEGHAPTAKPNPNFRHGLSADVPGEFALPRVLRFFLIETPGVVECTPGRAPQ